MATPRRLSMLGFSEEAPTRLRRERSNGGTSVVSSLQLVRERACSLPLRTRRIGDRSRERQIDLGRIHGVGLLVGR